MSFLPTAPLATRPTVRDLFYILAIMLVWGVNFPIAKLGVAAVPPLFLLAIRFAVVGLLVIPFFPRPRRQWGWLLLLSGMLGVAHFGVLFVALRSVDSALAAVLIQSQVPFSTLLGILILKERPSRITLIGMAIALVGVAIVFGEPHGPSSALAAGMVVFAALVWSCSNLVSKRLTSLHPLAMTGWMALLTAPQLALLSFFLETGQITALVNSGWVAAGTLAYMIFGATLFAYGGWYTLMQRYPLSTLSPYALTAPIFGVFASVIALGEPFTLRAGFGAALTLGGVALLTLVRRSPKA
jgi:O-acetylserine/cysteine efflux transporter